MAIILAIESSCDDTSAAIIEDYQVLSNIVSTQIVHKKYGGIVPELASRQHQNAIIPVVTEAIVKANISKSRISAMACTRGPGLLGSLLVGVCFAKSMAYSLGIPIIEVHHMRAHVLSHLIDDPKPTFPFLCLTVSGGHTQFIVVESPYEMNIIGETLDDAVGEAFDKSGKMLGLKYPAGPEIDKLAKLGIPKYTFPEPKVADLAFSFSGLKTAIFNFLKKNLESNSMFIQDNLHDICASIQDRIVSILENKIVKAIHKTGIKEVAISGGVSANSALRSRLKLCSEIHNFNVYIPKLEYCTDNAAMVGIAAYYKYLNKEFADQTLTPSARLKI